jgi:hypothetical protein
MGWKCIYAPLARGYHVRNVLPGNRRALPPEINMHSVKNRFLMRMKNISRRSLPEKLVLHYGKGSGCGRLLPGWEHTSLKAFWFWPAIGNASWPSAR